MEILSFPLFCYAQLPTPSPVPFLRHLIRGYTMNEILRMSELGQEN